MRKIRIQLIFITIATLSLLLGSCDFIIKIQASFARIQKREMIAISGGTYVQSDGTNSFAHNISSFKIAKYEVTYELWWAVYQWAITHGYIFANAGNEGRNGTVGATPTDAKYEPVTTINWRDAIIWCNAYSEASYRTPCYRYGGAVIKDSSDVNATACDDSVCDWAANGFRLPSEGEWQYAASAKGATPWNYAAGASTYFNDITDANPANGIFDGKDANDAVAVYNTYWNGSSWIPTGVNKPAVVGTKAANVLGICDMSGNIFEWCWDVTEEYPTGTQSDYRGPATGGNGRTIRGGTWFSYALILGVGERSFTSTFNANYSSGFRVALSH